MANQYTHKKNKYSFDDGIGTCISICGKNIYFYECDYDLIKHFKWCIDGSGYAFSYSKTNKGYARIYMHHLLGGKFYDHKNRNRIDNRRCNLRKCTRQQNSMNTSKQANTTSKYKGVSLKNDGRNKKWQSNIRVNNKLIYLGNYYHEEEAAVAYNKAAIEFFKEFANLNKI